MPALAKKINTFLCKGNFLAGEIAFLIIANALAGCLLAGPFYAQGSLSADTLMLFSFFRDSLFALNHFGEIAWWNPHIQTGFPTYYQMILNVDGSTPLFVFLQLIVLGLGKAGCYLTTFQPLYVLYFGFLIPLLASLSILFLARQIFENRLVILFIVSLSSFSPGMVSTLSDCHGLEQSAYGFFCAAAWLSFLRKPDAKSFLALTIFLAVVLIGLGLVCLYWTALFVPLFFLLTFAMCEGGPKEQCKRIMAGVPKWCWWILLAAIILSSLPALTTLADGADIIRAKLNTRIYPFHKLRTGNPMEFLTAGTPAMGFGWTPYQGCDKCCLTYTPLPYGNHAFTYGYLGMLILALSLVGLLAGNRVWRVRLFLMLFIASAIVTLVGSSPTFAAFLIALPPLRANNHFSDISYRVGTSFLLILCAGLGLEKLVASRDKWRWIAIPVFLALAIGSFILCLGVYHNSGLRHPLLDFALVMAGLYSTVLVCFAFVRNKKIMAAIPVVLVALTVADIATVAHAHVQHVLLPDSIKVKEPLDDGAKNSRGIESYYANTTLALRGVKKLADGGVDVFSLPPLALLDPVSLKTPGMMHPIAGEIKIKKQTFNTMDLEITSDKPCELFWRDAYFRYWKVSVNQTPIEISKVFGAFKAVAVPLGKTQVAFRFHPTAIANSLLVSYFFLTALILAWIFMPLCKKQQNP